MKIQKFVEMSGIPLLTEGDARGIVSDDHPLCFGFFDTALNSAAKLISDADVVLLLGRKQDFVIGYTAPPLVSKEAALMQIDPSPAEIGRNRSVDVGICAKEARELNFAFFTWMLKDRPFVIMKVATSLEGCFGRKGHSRTKLTSEMADSHVHGLRAEVDGIAVGSKTVIVDDPLLTARYVSRDRPLTRVVFDRRLRVSPSARLFGTRSAGPIIVVTTEAQCERESDRVRELRDVGADIEVIPEADDLGWALQKLGKREVTCLVVEGGKSVHHALWRDRYVDRVQMFIAPMRLGVDGEQWLNRDLVMKELATVRVTNLGPDVLVEGDVHWNH